VNKKNKTKVLICLSGGVDSSVSAALLVKADYDVTAAFMVNYDDPQAQESCWRGDYYDALRVSAKLGIKLLRLNFIKEYQKEVLDYVYKEYEAGRTPNPDVLCNQFVKFGAWLKKARTLGFGYVATGHYAQLKKKGNNFILAEAKDKNKDQTYFLHQLNQEQLSKVLFPIGEYNKSQVRKLAQKFDLPTAEKEESMGICFVGEMPMRDFLKNKIKVKSGKIIDSAGNILGEHDGLAFYTIGQRGLALGNIGGKPLYVVEKNNKTNELIVGFENDPKLYKREVEVDNMNWISGQEPKLPLKCLVRLRHRQELQSAAVVRPHEKGNLLIKFSKPQRAVTPGQYAVIYKSNVCLGGGVIF